MDDQQQLKNRVAFTAGGTEDNHKRKNNFTDEQIAKKARRGIKPKVFGFVLSGNACIDRTSDAATSDDEEEILMAQSRAWIKLSSSFSSTASTFSEEEKTLMAQSQARFKLSSSFFSSTTSTSSSTNSSSSAAR